MNLSTKNILILATIAVGIFVAGIVFTLTIGFVLAAALPEEPEKSTLPQPAQEKIPSPGTPNTSPSPTPENRIIPEEIPPYIPNNPPVRVAPGPELRMPFQDHKESIEPGDSITPGGDIRLDVQAPIERNQDTALA